MGMYRGFIAVTCIIMTALIWTLGQHAMGMIVNNVPSLVPAQIGNQTIDAQAIQEQAMTYYQVFKFTFLFITLIAIAWALREPKTQEVAI